MTDTVGKCNVCGEEWWYTGEDICPFCDSDDTTIVHDDDEEKEWGQYLSAWISA